MKKTRYIQTASLPVFQASHDACVSKAQSIVTGNLGKVRLQAFSHDSEHLAKTLAHWKKMKVQNVMVVPASTSEDETIRLQENEQIALFNDASVQTIEVPKPVKTVTKKRVAAKIAAPAPAPIIVETVEGTLETTQIESENDPMTTNSTTNGHHDDVTEVLAMPVLDTTQEDEFETLADVDARNALLEVTDEDIASLTVREVDDEVGTVFSDIEEVDIEYLWNGYLPLGKLVLLTGAAGIKKSFLSCDIAAHVTTGKAWPDNSPCNLGGVVMIAAEDNASDTLLKRLKWAGCDLTRVLDLSTVKRTDASLQGTSQHTSFILTDDMGRLERGIRRIGASLVILDPISATIKNAKNDQYVREHVLTPLSQLATRTGVCILMINHTNKGRYNEKKIITALGNARSFHEVARVSYLGTLDKEKEGVTNIQQIKNSCGPEAPMLSYKLSKNANSVFIDYLNRETPQIDILTRLDAENAALTRKRIVTLLYVRDRAMTPNEIAQQLEINANTVRPELKRMEEQGLLTKQSYGLYGLPQKYRKTA